MVYYTQRMNDYPEDAMNRTDYPKAHPAPGVSEAIRPFRLKLGLYAVVFALIGFASGGALSFAVVTLAMKIRQTEPGRIPWIVGAAVGAAVFLAVLLFRWPSRAETARKVDALGLKERAATMYALRNDFSGMAVLQRQDALASLGSVKMGRVRERIGWKPLLCCLIALLLAAASAFVPASWFAPEEDPFRDRIEEVLRMLREEEARLETQGEDVLAGQTRDLIDRLDDAESVLGAVGEINRAEDAAKDAARNEEAGRGAMREMLDVLEEAKRILLEKEEEGQTDGEEEAQQGEAGEGMEGEMEFFLPGEEGEGAEGRPGEGERSGNPDEEGRFGPGTEGGGPDGVSNMTEPVFDPISGAVPYGDVFSSYYSDYLKDAENGEVPFELQMPAESYFRELDQ